MENVNLTQREILTQSPNNSHALIMPVLPPTTQNSSLGNINTPNYKKDVKSQNVYVTKNSPLISPSIATSADLQMAQLPTQVQITTTLANVITNLSNNTNFVDKLKIQNEDITFQQNYKSATQLNNNNENALNTSSNSLSSFLSSNNQLSSLSTLLLNNPQAITMLVNPNLTQQNRNVAANLQNNILKDFLSLQQNSTQQVASNSNGSLTNNGIQLQNMNLLSIIQVKKLLIFNMVRYFRVYCQLLQRNNIRLYWHILHNNQLTIPI